MIFKLITAGQGDYRKILRRRSILLLTVSLVGLATVAASVLLGQLGILSSYFTQGFYAGVGSGVFGSCLIGFFGVRRLMKDETRMRAAEIKETDERNRMVSLRALSSTAWLLLACLYVGLLVSVAVNQTVFLTLLASAVVFFILFFVTLAYYRKTL